MIKDWDEIESACSFRSGKWTRKLVFNGRTGILMNFKERETKSTDSRKYTVTMRNNNESVKNQNTINPKWTNCTECTQASNKFPNLLTDNCWLYSFEVSVLMGGRVQCTLFNLNYKCILQAAELFFTAIYLWHTYIPYTYDTKRFTILLRTMFVIFFWWGYKL